MPKVTFLPANQTFEFESGKLPYGDHGKPESLLDIAMHFGFHLEHACGGSCACTTCHVWVRQGEHYQVHLDVTVGLPIAPLVTRRMSSDGELTAQGLFPRRYDEDTKLLFRERRRVTMLFEPEAIVMPDGQRLRRWAGVQDTASQFVQLSWLFSTRPELLRNGNTVDFALALPKNVDRWVYDVLGEEPVATHFGAVDAFHLKPRRVSRPGGDLVAEIWFAPTLRYLPARIRIEQDADTFIDLVLSRKPELAQQ